MTIPIVAIAFSITALGLNVWALIGAEASIVKLQELQRLVDDIEKRTKALEDRRNGNHQNRHS